MILIALGANLESMVGKPSATLAAALDALAKSGVRTSALSRIFSTPAWPDPSDPPFANAVARIETDVPPIELMGILHSIESLYGRTRYAKNAPRTLDLDLIDYDGRVEQGPPALPHPRAAERAFVLIPLRDVAPDWRHPAIGMTVEQLIAALPEESRAAIRVLAP